MTGKAREKGMNIVEFLLFYVDDIETSCFLSLLANRKSDLIYCWH